MGVDVPCDGTTTEIGPINALIEAGHYDSPAYDQMLQIHSQDTEWAQKTRDSFNFTKITLTEWNVLSQYSLVYDLLTDIQRGQISKAILSPNSSPKKLRKVPTKYVTESTALGRLTDSFCLTPKKQEDQIQDILDAFCSSNTFSRKNDKNEKPPLPFLIKRQRNITADSISKLQMQNNPQEEEEGGFFKRSLPSGSDILGMLTGGGNRSSRLKSSANNILVGNVSEKKIEKAGAAPPALMKYLSTMRTDIPRETEGRYSYVSFIKNLNLLRERLPEIKDLFKDPNDFAIWALEIEAEIKSLTWKRKNERRRKYRKRIESSSSSDWTDITEEEFLTFGTETSDTSCKDNNDKGEDDPNGNNSKSNNIESSSDDWSNWRKSKEQRWSSSSTVSESIY